MDYKHGVSYWSTNDGGIIRVNFIGNFGIFSQINANNCNS